MGKLSTKQKFEKMFLTDKPLKPKGGAYSERTSDILLLLKRDCLEALVPKMRRLAVNDSEFSKILKISRSRWSALQSTPDMATLDFYVGLIEKVQF